MGSLGNGEIVYFDIGKESIFATDGKKVVSGGW